MTLSKCPICNDVIKLPGATVISPPTRDGKCEIRDVCKECYESNLAGLFEEKFSPLNLEE